MGRSSVINLDCLSTGKLIEINPPATPVVLLPPLLLHPLAIPVAPLLQSLLPLQTLAPSVLCWWHLFSRWVLNQSHCRNVVKPTVSFCLGALTASDLQSHRIVKYFGKNHGQNCFVFPRNLRTRKCVQFLQNMRARTFFHQNSRPNLFSVKKTRP